MREWSLDTALRISSVDEFIDKFLTARGLNEQMQVEFLRPDYMKLIKLAHELPNLKPAITRIGKALKGKQKIVVYGDYDIDGITASALLHDALGRAGADISVYIPDRFEEGYGLNKTALAYLQREGAELVISVDCGVTAVDEARYANEHGIDLIITDHHGLPEKLPTASLALINPKLTPDSPLYNLAGVGVAFMLVVALKDAGVLELATGQEKWLLDLVALGTICDVVPLDATNHALASYGLQVMRRTRRAGIVALARASAVDLAQVGSEELGFRFGPRLNAAGRLEHAQVALELLTTTDSDRAEVLAGKLSDLNAARQQLTEQTYEQAVMKLKGHENDRVVVLSDPGWSHGIIGIVASRLVERTHRPVILLQVQGEVAKGSARSPKGFSIIDAISQQAKYLKKFGGHAYAAGMTLNSADIEAFTQALNDDIDASQKEPAAETLQIDVQIDASMLDLKLHREISRLSPFGQDNPEPILMSRLKVMSFRPVGSDLSHLQIRFTVKQHILGGIAFRKADRWAWLKEGEEVEVAFTLGINDWQGVRSPQLLVIDMRQIDG